MSNQTLTAPFRSPAERPAPRRTPTPRPSRMLRRAPRSEQQSGPSEPSTRRPAHRAHRRPPHTRRRWLWHAAALVICRAAIVGLIVVAVVAVGAGGQRLGIDSVPAVAAAVAIGSAGLLLARRHRARRTARRRPVILPMLASVLLGVLGSASWSYTGYLSAAGAAPIAVRTGDWMRDHGMNPIVDRLEQYLYAGTAPHNGRVKAAELPVLAEKAQTARGAGHLTPMPARDLIDDKLSGEGQWTPNGRVVNGRPVAYTTFVRPDPSHTDVVAAAVWLDPTSTRVTYVPGTKQPGSWAWGSGIPTSQRPGLVAAFNSGWKFKDIPGGYRTEGRTPVPLVDGQASLVLRAHGPADIGSWGSQVTMTADTVTVRQNLALIVDGGRPVSGIGSRHGPHNWGSRRWEAQYTNRSGLGITAHHALVYVSGANLSTETLAEALAKLGAVRAMELDIHATNPTFNFFYPAPGGNPVVGARLTSTMKSSSERFLAPDQRDFFAVTLSGTTGR